jgi:molecular chaperone DnaK
MRLSRAKLDQLVEDLIVRSRKPCEKALADAGLSASDIKQVVLVGGMTRMPAVQKLVEEFFGQEPHKGVNPDEVVGIGAAIQGGVLAGDVKDVVLLDVTPLSLGLETLGGVMTTLIERNTTIPAKKQEVFTTAADNQTQVEIHVLQGERQMAPDNRTLGRFHLIEVPSAPRGVPQIEVAFDIDANGILNVSAKDTATGKTQQITITSSSGLDDSEVESMIKDAEGHAEEDKQRKDLIEARNNLDSIIYSTSKLITDNKEKLSEADVKATEEAVDEGRTVLKEKEDDLAALKEAIDKVTVASHKVAEEMYKKAAPEGAGAGAGAGAAPGAPPEAEEAEVVDAEVVDNK